jgi:hypothetical protein
MKGVAIHLWIGYSIGLGLQPKYSSTKVQNFIVNFKNCVEKKLINHHTTSQNHLELNELGEQMV